MTTERSRQSAPRSGPPEPPNLGLNLDPDTNYPSTREDGLGVWHVSECFERRRSGRPDCRVPRIAYPPIKKAWDESDFPVSRRFIELGDAAISGDPARSAS